VVWSSVGAGLAAAAAIWLVVVTNSTRSAEPADLRTLVAAVGTDRTIEPRLTGGFEYGPLRGPLRSGATAAERLSPAVRIAVAEIKRDAASQGNAALRPLGIAYLVSGDLDLAVSTLEQAIAQPNADARAFSDLSAAYLMRAASDPRPDDVSKAIAMADRAIQLAPRLAEAHFNRACALERASRANEARQAWQEYLDLDSKSGWADEAAAHLSRLRGANDHAVDDPSTDIGTRAKPSTNGRL
jgi:tetratricopeptide (TPR) repeat protein